MLAPDHPSALKYQRQGLDYHWRVLKRRGNASSYARGLALMEAQFPESSGEALLDFGCGTGILARRLTRKGYTVTGYDPYGPAIEYARRKVPEATFITALPERTWPYLVSFNVAEHMEDPDVLARYICAAGLAVVQCARPGMDTAAVPTWDDAAFDQFATTILKNRPFSVIYDSPKEIAWRIG